MALRPHDLVRLTAADAIEAIDRPSWVLASLRAAPWVVARRARGTNGRIPVGVRGETRDRRFAAALDPSEIDAMVAPEDLTPCGTLWRSANPRAHPIGANLGGRSIGASAVMPGGAGYPRLSESVGLYAQVVDARKDAGMTVEIDLAAALRGPKLAPMRAHPAFDALEALACVFDKAGLVWGPSGAAGYEIAAVRPVLTPESDLDIVVRAGSPGDIDALRSVLPAMRAAPIRVDLLVETPCGAVAVPELFGAEEQVMLRTREGPRLVARGELFPGAC